MELKMTIFSPNQTSARMLIQYGRKKFGIENTEECEIGSLDRYVLLYDIFIKARSYYIMNKIFFFVALFSGIAVLLWPSVSVVTDEFSLKIEFLKSAIVQTTITATAGLTFSIYSQYKKSSFLQKT